MTALPDSEAATSLVLNALLLEHAADRVGDRAAVDDGAVDDAVGRHRLDGEGDRRGSPCRRPSARRAFDGARSDVEADDALWILLETKHGVMSSVATAVH